MSRPQIPGFYFDEARNRYFKITNGDQRLNSSYSNNSVRAIERRKENEKDRQSKRNKKRDKSLDVSLDAQKKHNPVNFQNFLLRTKLRYDRRAPSITQRLSSITKILLWAEFPTWPYSPLNAILLARGPYLELYPGNFVPGSGTQPIARICSLGMDPQLRISHVQSHVNWLAYLYGFELHICKWDCSLRTFRRVLHRQILEAGLMADEYRECRDDFIMQMNTCRFFPYFDEEFLVLHLERGYKLVIDLEDFLISSLQINLLTDEILPTNDTFFSQACDTLLFNTGKFLVVINKSGARREWRFDSPVHAYYSSSLQILNATKDIVQIVKLYIITAKDVIIREFDSESLKILGKDVVIPHGNDNQARPLIYRFRDQIMVEEREGIFKVIDMKLLVEKTVKCKNNLPSPREMMPRGYEQEGKFYLSDSRRTYVLHNEAEYVKVGSSRGQ